MRLPLAVLLVVVGMPSVAIAGGIVLEIKPSQTASGPRPSRHIETTATPDGGLVAIGWAFGDWQLGATLMGHDVVTVNGGHDDNLMMAGVDLQRRHRLTPRLDLTLRGGVFQAGISGVAETPLEQYRGGGVRLGAGLRYRTVTCGDVTVSLTVEVVRNQLWLASDGAKDLHDHTSGVLVGMEYAQARDVGRRCTW